MSKTDSKTAALPPLSLALRSLLALGLGLVLCLIPRLSLAQSEAEEVQAENQPTAIAQAENQPASAKGPAPLDGALDSQREKALLTLQKRPFQKARRFELDVALGLIPSDIFLNYLALKLGAAYHFSETWALDFQASYIGCFSERRGPAQDRMGAQGCLRFRSSAYNKLQHDEQTAPALRAIVQREYQTARFHFSALWSPVAMKFALENRFILKLDLDFSAGLGLLLLEDPEPLRPGKSQYLPSPEASLGLGLRLYLLDWLSIRFDFKQYFYLKRYRRALGLASECTLGPAFLLP